jgi:hypothetical protein
MNEKEIEQIKIEALETVTDVLREIRKKPIFDVLKEMKVDEMHPYIKDAVYHFLIKEILSEAKLTLLERVGILDLVKLTFMIETAMEMQYEGLG